MRNLQSITIISPSLGHMPLPVIWKGLNFCRIKLTCESEISSLPPGQVETIFQFTQSNFLPASGGHAGGFHLPWFSINDLILNTMPYSMCNYFIWFWHLAIKTIWFHLTALLLDIISFFLCFLDITVMVDWALKINYQSIYLFFIPLQVQHNLQQNSQEGVRNSRFFPQPCFGPVWISTSCLEAWLAPASKSNCLVSKKAPITWLAIPWLVVDFHTTNAFSLFNSL